MGQSALRNDTARQAAAFYNLAVQRSYKPTVAKSRSQRKALQDVLDHDSEEHFNQAWPQRSGDAGRSIWKAGRTGRTT